MRKTKPRSTTVLYLIGRAGCFSFVDQSQSILQQSQSNPELCDTQLGTLSCFCIFDFSQDHQKTCPYVEEQCRDCEANIQRRHLNTHYKEECPKRLVECVHCQKKYRFMEKTVSIIVKAHFLEQSTMDHIHFSQTTQRLNENSLSFFVINRILYRHTIER